MKDVDEMVYIVNLVNIPYKLYVCLITYTGIFIMLGEINFCRGYIYSMHDTLNEYLECFDRETQNSKQQHKKIYLCKIQL